MHPLEVFWGRCFVPSDHPFDFLFRTRRPRVIEVFNQSEREHEIEESRPERSWPAAGGNRRARNRFPPLCSDTFVPDTAGCGTPPVSFPIAYVGQALHGFSRAYRSGIGTEPICQCQGSAGRPLRRRQREWPGRKNDQVPSPEESSQDGEAEWSTRSEENLPGAVLPVGRSVCPSGIEGRQDS